VTVNSGGTVSVSGAVSLSGSLTVNGVIKLTGSGDITRNNGTVSIGGSGTIDITGAAAEKTTLCGNPIDTMDTALSGLTVAPGAKIKLTYSQFTYNSTSLWSAFSSEGGDVTITIIDKQGTGETWRFKVEQGSGESAITKYWNGTAVVDNDPSSGS
ncbi:MAG: hypothetical protein LBD85_06725, partial [Oscillospiraceae bacterium]|nr:hypothetical protein [Oscillospiraceae bacterium]